MIVAGTVAVLLLLLLLPVLGGGYYVVDDLGRRELPFRAYYVNHLARGEGVAWTPHIYGGYYLFGDAHTGIDHPVIALLYRVVPLHGAFTIETLVRYPLLIAGTFLLLRRWGLPADASLFGGATLSFGGFCLMHFGHVPMGNVTAHLPWQLLAADILFRDGSPRQARWAWLAIALLTGSQCLVGAPHTVYMSAQAEAIYLLALGVSGQVRRGPLLAWVLAKLLGGLIGCAQLLPTLETLRLAERANITLSEVLSVSLHPADLLQLFSPLWFRAHSYLYQPEAAHEVSLYCGSVATVLSAWALIGWRRLGSLRAWIAVAAAFVIIGLLFAMGRLGGLAVLQYYLPIVGKFRIPSRYILIAHLGIATLTAVGYVALTRARADRGREPRALWLLLLVPLGQLIWLGSGFAGNGFHPPERFALRAISVLTFLTAFLLVCAAARRVRFAFTLLILFAFVDQGMYAVSFFARGRFATDARQDVTLHTAGAQMSGTGIRAEPVPEYQRTARWLASQRFPVMTLEAFLGVSPPCPARGRERIIGWFHDINLIQDVYAIDGYASLLPRRQLDYARPAARQVAGVRWELRLRDAEEVWEEIAGPLPYVRLVGRAVASEDPRRTLEEIDPSVTAIVSAPLDLPPGDVGTAVLEAEHPGRLEIVTKASAERLLVVAESYHPGWWAALDGQWRHPIRVYGDFLGLVVPEGRHRVEFEFRPWSLWIGSWVSLAALGLTLALFGGSFRGLKRRG